MISRVYVVRMIHKTGVCDVSYAAPEVYSSEGVKPFICYLQIKGLMELKSLTASRFSKN